jgi:hypothetical protein
MLFELSVSNSKKLCLKFFVSSFSFQEFRFFFVSVFRFSFSFQFFVSVFRFNSSTSEVVAFSFQFFVSVFRFSFSFQVFKFFVSSFLFQVSHFRFFVSSVLLVSAFSLLWLFRQNHRNGCTVPDESPRGFWPELILAQFHLRPARGLRTSGNQSAATVPSQQGQFPTPKHGAPPGNSLGPGAAFLCRFLRPG